MRWKKANSPPLAVLFLIFNEGYLATGPDTDPLRHDLTTEAIRLARQIRSLMPDRARGFCEPAYARALT